MRSFDTNRISRGNTCHFKQPLLGQLLSHSCLSEFILQLICLLCSLKRKRFLTYLFLVKCMIHVFTEDQVLSATTDTLFCKSLMLKWCWQDNMIMCGTRHPFIHINIYTCIYISLTNKQIKTRNCDGENYTKMNFFQRWCISNKIFRVLNVHACMLNVIGTFYENTNLLSESSSNLVAIISYSLALNSINILSSSV